MHDLSMPLWERYLMTIEEASSYFRIRGEQAPPTCQRIQRGMCCDERKPYAHQEKEI